jgi:hypothetical protein
MFILPPVDVFTPICACSAATSEESVVESGRCSGLPDSFRLSFDTKQDLRDYGFPDERFHYTALGGAAKGDGLGGVYYFDSGSTDDDDDNSTLLPAGNVGRYKKLI